MFEWVGGAINMLVMGRENAPGDLAERQRRAFAERSVMSHLTENERLQLCMEMERKAAEIINRRTAVEDDEGR